MKRPRRLTIAAALLLLVGMGLFLCLRPRKEPTWQGKTYSQWFAEFRQAKVRRRQTSQSWIMLPSSSKPVLSAGYYDDIDGLLRDPAADALRAMGTNIVPLLVAEIRHEDSGLLQVYRKLYFKLPVPLKRVAPNPPAGRDEIRGDAALALAALRGDAGAAVPPLFQAFATAAPAARMQFQESLHRLPFDSTAFDAALQTLVKRGEIFFAVSTIARFGVWNPSTARVLTNAVFSTNAPASEVALGQLRYFRRYSAFVLPALRLALKSSNQQVRWAAATVLESYESDAAGALPELLDALKSEDDETRYRATRVLDSIGTNALAAAPALRAATNDSSVMVQRRATRALNNLKAGANE
jgi:HEAT repeats